MSPARAILRFRRPGQCCGRARADPLPVDIAAELRRDDAKDAKVGAFALPGSRPTIRCNLATLFTFSNASS